MYEADPKADTNINPNRTFTTVSDNQQTVQVGLAV